MRPMDKSFKMAILPAALAAMFGSAMAEDDVAELVKPDASISLGVGNWFGDRQQQGIYDGMREGGTKGVADIDFTRRNDETGTWLKLNGSNLGLDTRELRFEVLRQGDIGGFAEYSKTPRDNPYTINTPLQGIGTTSLTVGTQVGSFAAQEVKLGTEREALRLGAFKNLMTGLDFKLDVKNEDKKGTRQWGWGSAALFSVEPIDSTTRQLEAILQYAAKDLQLSGGYYGSWYTNHHSQVLEQLNGITGGTSASFNAITPMSLPLDNQAHELFLDGDYSFSPTTKGNIKLSHSRATQNETLPSYGLAAPNAPFAGAPSSLNGVIDTTLLQLGLSARPLPKLSLTANLRYNDVKDKTPAKQYIQTVSGGTTTKVYNTPHSYETWSGKLEAAYQLPDRYKLIGGVDYVTQDRSTPGPSSTKTTAGVTTDTNYVPFRSVLNETTYRMQLRRAMAEDFSGSVSYLRSDRNGSSYTAAAGTLPYSNQINPLHIADRSRDKWRLAADWTPANDLSLQFRVDQSKDEYPDNGRPYGLKDGDSTAYAVDGNYDISKRWKLAAWYSREKSSAREVSYRQAGAPVADAIKESRLSETSDGFGFNLRATATAKLEIGAGFEWFKSVSRYPQTVSTVEAGTAYPAGAVGPLPEIDSKLARFKLDAKYDLDKASALRFEFVHERWQTDDWSWNFANGSPFTYFSGNQTCTGCSVTPVGLVDGTRVTGSSTQTANFIGMRYIYKFQ